MIYKLSGAANLARGERHEPRHGGFRERAIKVFQDWGFPEPEQILVKEHLVENDIGADPSDSIVAAVVKLCAERIHRRKFWTNLTDRRVPAAMRPSPLAVKLGPSPASPSARPEQGEFDL